MRQNRPNKQLQNLQKRLETLESKLEKLLDTIEMLSYGVATHQELLGALAEDARSHMEKLKTEQKEIKKEEKLEEWNEAISDFDNMGLY